MTSPSPRFSPDLVKEVCAANAPKLIALAVHIQKVIAK